MGKGNSRAAGAKLEVRVHPRSSRNEIVAEEDGRIRLYVTAPPEAGKANEAAISLLAGRFGVPKSNIRIVRGHNARNKTFLVEGLTEKEALGGLRPKARPGRRVGPQD